MKFYKKEYEDAFSTRDYLTGEKAGSTIGTADELAERFEEVIRRGDRELFSLVVNFIWLELHFTFNGKRREAHFANSITHDRSFSQFLRISVGTGHKTLTSSLTFPIIVSYLKDFFPDFMDHDPREEPEYFAFPYKHVSLDFLAFVYKMDDRIEMLQYAEDRKMPFGDFANWAVNQAFCYNDEVGEDVYTLTKLGGHWAHINKPSVKKQWHKDNLNFESYGEET